VIALLLLKMIFQPPFFRSTANLPLQLLLISTDFFLVSRFLFAFRAAGLYPFSSEAVQLSFLAFLLVPYILFCALLGIRQNLEPGQALNFCVYSVMVPAVAALFIRDSLWLSLIVVSISLAAMAFRFHSRGRFRSGWFDSGQFQRLPVDALLILFFAFALVLQWLGTGEAVRIAGVRVPLALIYQPLFLVGTAYYLWRLKENLLQEKSSTVLRNSWSLLMKLFVFLLSSFLLSFLMADFGFFLLYCLPVLFILLGLAVLYLAQYELKWKAAGVVMILPLTVFVLVFSSFHTLDRILPSTYSRWLPLQRVLLAVDPSALEDSGYLNAERQVGHQRIFLAYAHSGFRGGGYMNRTITSAVSATALNDNVSSVFLLNDFGALGFGAVLIVLLSWLWLWRKAAGTGKLSYLHFLSLSSLITLVYVDLYMILGNCGIVLFTGKNVFFWGLNSTSDIFQSTVLISLVLAPLAKSSTAAVPEPVSFVGTTRTAEREFHA
jgi:hypothetical protein